MSVRTVNLLVLVSWMTAMSWLFIAKVLPPLRGGDPPQYSELLPDEGEQVAIERWVIRHGDRELGWAETRLQTAPDASSVLESRVRFDRLPLDEFAAQALGGLTRMAQELTGARVLGTVKLEMSSRIEFSALGEMERFTSHVDMDNIPDFIAMEGRVEGGQLVVKPTMAVPHASPAETTHRDGARQPSDGNDQESAGEGDWRRRPLQTITFEAPRNALVSDSMSPRPKLPNLRLGQKWTFQTYRPLAAGEIAIVEAHVERKETIRYDGEAVDTHVVVYRNDAGSGFSLAREPIGQLWVRDDGAVLRQEVRVVGLKILFERLP